MSMSYRFLANHCDRGCFSVEISQRTSPILFMTGSFEWFHSESQRNLGSRCHIETGGAQARLSPPIESDRHRR
jgi:hypothetical protein